MLPWYVSSVNLNWSIFLNIALCDRLQYTTGYWSQVNDTTGYGSKVNNATGYGSQLLITWRVSSSFSGGTVGGRFGRRGGHFLKQCNRSERRLLSQRQDERTRARGLHRTGFSKFFSMKLNESLKTSWVELRSSKGAQGAHKVIRASEQAVRNSTDKLLHGGSEPNCCTAV